MREQRAIDLKREGNVLLSVFISVSVDKLSGAEKELGDSGEQRVIQQGAELCTAVRGEKKTKQVAVNKRAAPQAFH